MKIQHPLFFLLWSAKLAISADAPIPSNIVSVFPTCIQRAQCLQYGVQTYCLNDATIACVCQRQALMFFYFIYGCAIAYGSCSNADVVRTIRLAAEMCNSRGYDVNSIINQNLATPTFSYSISIPTVSNLLTNVIDNNLPASSSSSPTTTSDVDNGSTTSGLSTGAIIGIVVGLVAVIGIIAGLIVFCMKHRAKQQRLQAMTAPPPPPAPQPAPAGPPPPPMSQYGSPPPPQGFSPYTAPVYPPQQQPVIQQQQQPLMHGYHELEQPAGYYAPVKKEEYPVTPSTATTTTATPAPMPPGQQGQYFQELPAQERPVQVGQGLAEEGHVYVEMPSDGRK